MKRPVILTGASGSGKTTILQYLAKKYPDQMFAMDTGDYFKAKFALAYDRTFVAPPVMLTGVEAFRWFVDTQMDRGVALYEAFKKSGEISGHGVINWIETDRALMADMPARAVFATAKHRADKHLLTTAINESELHYLRDLFDYPFVVCLHCENPKSRNGDNRTPVSEWECNEVYRYRLEQSYTVADSIYRTIKSWE
jgi:GTPase SAR1 family protein